MTPDRNVGPGEKCRDCGHDLDNLGLGPDRHACTNRGRRYGYGPGDRVQVGDAPGRYVVVQVECGGSVIVKVGPVTQWVAASVVCVPDLAADEASMLARTA